MPPHTVILQVTRPVRTLDTLARVGRAAVLHQVRLSLEIKFAYLSRLCLCNLSKVIELGCSA